MFQETDFVFSLLICYSMNPEHNFSRKAITHGLCIIMPIGCLQLSIWLIGSTACTIHIDDIGLSIVYRCSGFSFRSIRNLAL